MLTRFQSSSALVIRPNTGWTRPGIGGRVRGAFLGVKNRAKRFLARPGIQSAMSRVGRGLGTGVALVKGAAGTLRRKAGFSGSQNLAEFRRRGLAGYGSAHLIGSNPRSYHSSSRLVEFRRRRGFRFRRRKPTFGGHTSKGAAYGALSGGALGASLGGAGSYAAARKAGLGRAGALGVGAIGGVLGGVQGGLSGALTGGTVGATAYGAKRIREDRRRR